MITRELITFYCMNFGIELLELLCFLLKLLVFWLRAVYEFCGGLIHPVYKDLSGETILITGAGSGIGRLMCSKFARYCNNIIALDINEPGLQETAKFVLAQTGVVVKIYHCDLRSVEDVNGTANQILRDCGRVTVLVNNAGIVNGKMLLDLSNEEIDNCFKVNVLSHFWLIKCFLPSMLGRKHVTDTTQGDSDKIELEANLSKSAPHGHIVNISSVASFSSATGLSDYCATKAAVAQLSCCLEFELCRMGCDKDICVTCVHPYLINTNMFYGWTTKRPWLFHELDADDTAERIVNATRRNQKILVLGRLLYAVPTILSLLPLECYKKLADYVGALEMADKLKKHRDSR